jgi:hypothetical protein
MHPPSCRVVYLSVAHRARAWDLAEAYPKGQNRARMRR